MKLTLSLYLRFQIREKALYGRTPIQMKTKEHVGARFKTQSFENLKRKSVSLQAVARQSTANSIQFSERNLSNGHFLILSLTLNLQVLDEGKVIEFDEPYLLLQNPESLFYQMVEHTGKSSAAKLNEVARQTYELRHEDAEDSLLELPHTQIEATTDRNSDSENPLSNESEPLLVFESSV